MASSRLCDRSAQGILSSACRQPSCSISPQAHTQLRLRIVAISSVNLADLLKKLRLGSDVLLRAAPASLPARNAFTSLNDAIDLDLQGSIGAIQAALSLLQSFPIHIQGRANPDGDGWYC